jgi:16S rRNA (adenine1518-N6/adenine1519-N6)-dimethyltransferase
MSAHKQVNAAHRSTRSPRKAKLGQNFLIDQNAARRIVEALGDISSSVVVEVGSGRGALTKALAERAGHLVAVELDEALALELRKTYATKANVHIVQGNFLKLRMPELLNPIRESPTTPVKVVGNIPYYITSDILLHLFEQHEFIETAVLMVQKEVADRLVAGPGTRDYGLLTVTAQLVAEIERLFTLPPGAFFPPPQVCSSVLRLRMSAQAGRLGIDAKSFLDFCKQAFAQKRKTLFNNLRSRYSEETIHAALQSERVDARVRAEALSLDQLAGVHKSLLRHGVHDR